jgi:carboxypeptidase Taq
MPSDLLDSYDELLSRSKKLVLLSSAIGILHWDLETKMPPRGLEQRSEQLAVLDVMAHQELVSPDVAILLDRIEGHEDLASLDDVQRRNVHLFRKAYDESARLPERLVADLSKQSAITVGAWKKAKAAQDFKLFRSDLARMIELRAEAADIMMQVKGTKTPYDALLDSYEPGMTAERVTEVFTGMKKGLMKVLRKIEGSGFQSDISITERKVPIESQRHISDIVMDFVGYDTLGHSAGGRLDETEHPFSTGYYDDVRITTHYFEDRYTSSLFSVLHEAGHALYEQNQPAKWKYQPVGAAASYGIHESQSRFVENIVGRSPEFLRHMLPRLRTVTDGVLDGVGLDQFVAAVNHVEPSRIRIEADEVTYGLHIIIRFEMERDLFSGKIGVDELPQVWVQKYQDYLGVDVRNDSEGVMQDTHWASGYYGYFPSYALGNIYGGMFLAKMNTALPHWKQSIEKGDFTPVRSWLMENVHSKGNLYDPADLVKAVTGRDMDIAPFIGYLDEKFSGIYGY